jgi:AcrR family transcriptional regulator
MIMASSRVERRKERTREAIKGAVIALAAERDFQNVGLEDVAVRADVARGTIYNLYSCKENLLSELVAPLMQDMAQKAERLVAAGSVPFHRLCSILTEAWEKDGGTLGLMLRLRRGSMGGLEEVHKRLVDAFLAAFASLQEAKHLRTATPLDAAVLLFRVAVPALDAFDPDRGPGRDAFLEAMRGLFLRS